MTDSGDVSWTTGVGRSPAGYLQHMEIIISGARVDERGHIPEVELWRMPFRGWGEPNRVHASSWCRPERYEVEQGGISVCAGTIAGPIVSTGEAFTLRVERPAGDRTLERALADRSPT